jgi:hypothetical protein
MGFGVPVPVSKAAVGSYPQPARAGCRVAVSRAHRFTLASASSVRASAVYFLFQFSAHECNRGWGGWSAFPSDEHSIARCALNSSYGLSVASRRPAVSRHPALWSPDFPLHDAKVMQRLPGQLHHLHRNLESLLQGVVLAGQVICPRAWVGIERL